MKIKKESINNHVFEAAICRVLKYFYKIGKERSVPESCF